MFQGVCAVTVRGRVFWLLQVILEGLLIRVELVDSVIDFGGFIKLLRLEQLRRNSLQKRDPFNFLRDGQLEHGFLLRPVQQCSRDCDPLPRRLTLCLRRGEERVFENTVRILHVVGQLRSGVTCLGSFNCDLQNLELLLLLEHFADKSWQLIKF